MLFEGVNVHEDPYIIAYQALVQKLYKIDETKQHIDWWVVPNTQSVGYAAYAAHINMVQATINVYVQGNTTTPSYTSELTSPE